MEEILASLMIFIGGFLVGIGACMLWMRKDAIQHHAACYDSKTGEFRWIDQCQ